MSGHADTIRRGLSEYDSEIDSVREQHEALDALLAENQRLREALEQIAAANLTLYKSELTFAGRMRKIARETLAGE